jgi:hypothetical protein
LPPLDDYAIQPLEIQQGVVTLKKRQQRLTLVALTSLTICIASVIGLFVEQDLVYGFFGLTTEVQQLHLPVTVDQNLAKLGDSQDYFMALLGWFGWLILKIFSAFIGAFFVVSFLKKFRYFAQRFQSFVLRFVGWLIAFILIWTGLTVWQHDIRDKNKDNLAKVIYYDSNIHESEIARYLQDAELAAPIKSYLLAQTALLHEPQDIAAARPHLLKLMEAEKNHAEFDQYGFKAEQLWIMQQQVYAKTLTPVAKTVEPKQQQAEQLSEVMRILIAGMVLVTALLSIILFLLVNMIKSRSVRIEQRIHE